MHDIQNHKINPSTALWLGLWLVLGLGLGLGLELGLGEVCFVVCVSVTPHLDGIQRLCINLDQVMANIDIVRQPNNPRRRNGVFELIEQWAGAKHSPCKHTKTQQVGGKGRRAEI
jgi:hypothetical protein